MATISAGPEIERLIQLLARLPGLGAPSARRAAVVFFKKHAAPMAPLPAALQTAIDKIEVCRPCGNIDSQNPCAICTDPRRDGAAIVVVADVADLWALERAAAIKARYHVLGGTLSPLDGIGPDDLTIEALVKRAHDPAVGEIILALTATADGQSPAPHITTTPTHSPPCRPGAASRAPPPPPAAGAGADLIYPEEVPPPPPIRSRTPF